MSWEEGTTRSRGIGAMLLQAVEDEVQGAGGDEAHLNATLNFTC